jgi:hypothetical protein
MAVGSTIGSILGTLAGSYIPIPGVGEAVGAKIGAGIGNAAGTYLGSYFDQPSQGNNGNGGSYLFGNPQRTEQFPRFGQQQQQDINQLVSRLQGGLQNPSSGFDPIAKQATNQFHSKTVPSIAERFTARGTGGSQRSGAFKAALGNAGAGLEQGLAALKSQYGMQRENQLQNLLAGLLTTPQYDTGQYQQTYGAAPHLLSALGNIGSSYFNNQGIEQLLQYLKGLDEEKQEEIQPGENILTESLPEQDRAQQQINEIMQMFSNRGRAQQPQYI